MRASKKRDRDLKHLSDQELMEIVQSGDFSPAGELYDRYAKRVYNHSYRFLGNREAAEDATQEVFVKMMRHANQFRNGAPLLRWLLSITGNHCRDKLRSLRVRPTHGEDGLELVPAPDDLSPERDLERQDAERIVQEALTRLEPDQREAIVLSRYEGCTYAQIALISGCSEGAVKTRVFRAMNVLKKALTRDAQETTNA